MTVGATFDWAHGWGWAYLPLAAGGLVASLAALALRKNSRPFDALMGSLNFFAPHERMHAVAVHTPDLIGYGRLKDAREPSITLEAQAAHVAR